MEFGITIIVGLALYFLPVIIAYNRNHNNLIPIFIIDLFFGWTLLGWVICLAWSTSSNVESSPKPRGTVCTRCGGDVPKEALACRHCGANFD